MMFYNIAIKKKSPNFRGFQANQPIHGHQHYHDGWFIELKQSYSQFRTHGQLPRGLVSAT
jgi:hypothetical protein